MTGKLRLDELERQPFPGLDAPSDIQFTRGGTALTYLRPVEGSPARGVWRHDLRTGERRLLIPPGSPPQDPSLATEDELHRQRIRDRGEGVAQYQRAATADVVVALVGGRCLVSTDGAPAVPAEGIESAQAAVLSPDGRRVAWVRAGDLFVSYISRAESPSAHMRLTSDASEGVSNGLPDFAAAEELDRNEGIWWSATSEAIAFAHVDERAIPVFEISDPDADPPSIEAHHYPFAGGPNASVELRIVRPDEPVPDGSPIPLEIGDGYLARVVSHPLGGWLVAILSRDQRSLRWSRVSPDGGSSQLWVETAAPWINLDSMTRVLGDGRILRVTEASGFAHLVLRQPDGSSPRALTEGPWVVTDVAHVDEERGEVLVIGTADGVLERHLYAVPLDATRPIDHPMRRTLEPGSHEVTVRADGGAWVDTISDLRAAARVVLRERDGGGETLIHEPSTSAAALDLVIPELLEVPAEDGTQLQVAVFRPRAADASPPPAVLWIYGGPHFQHVQDTWELMVRPALRQALVRAGFTVVVADNRGTANRGLAFESAIDHALGSVELADQVRAVRFLADRGDLDASRIGITGGSYGGYLTIMALLRHPDVFHAGVAAAPVVDWDGYDTAYTERYLGTPAAAPDAYRRSSLLPRARELRRPLLVIHGAIDENVHLRHSRRLADELAAAGIELNLEVLPGQRHLVRSPEELRARDRRTIAFLCEALAVPLPDELREGHVGD
jgi:dipeptidyl-peptidase 4